MQKLGLIAVTVSLALSGCFPNKQATLLQREIITPKTRLTSPTKAFLLDASCVLFPNGFSVRNDTVNGIGQRFWLDRADKQLKMRAIPLDSVAAMTYYELKSSGGQVFASFLLGLFGATLTPLSIYCISCPKCCFGSCPTVYTYDGANAELEAELFSYSISKFFQQEDLDRLHQPLSNDGHYRLRLTNEALETHYINTFSLIAVSHSLGTQIFPSPDGRLVVMRNLTPPLAAVNQRGKEVLNLIASHDERWYRSDTSLVRQLSHEAAGDWIDLKVKVPPKAQKVKMALRLRNTLLSTIIFYDVVLASQGLEALAWIEKMNTDSLYAAQFYAQYNAIAGIAVKTLRNGEWVQQATINDIGPIAWKEIAVELPVDQSGEACYRLQFFPDNFMIDYVAFDFDTSAVGQLMAQEVRPTEFRDQNGNRRNELLALIARDDDQFLVTNPGEYYELLYDLPAKSADETSVFIRSKGYYIEWLRGDWLAMRESGYRFQLFDIDRTLAQLRQSWLQSKDLMEKKFFETRIPLKEMR